MKQQKQIIKSKQDVQEKRVHQQDSENMSQYGTELNLYEKELQINLKVKPLKEVLF